MFNCLSYHILHRIFQFVYNHHQEECSQMTGRRIRLVPCLVRSVIGVSCRQTLNNWLSPREFATSFSISKYKLVADSTSSQPYSSFQSQFPGVSILNSRFHNLVFGLKGLWVCTHPIWCIVSVWISCVGCHSIPEYLLIACLQFYKSTPSLLKRLLITLSDTPSIIQLDIF